MGKSKPPPTPDYSALATQQGALNKEAATQAWLMNNSPVQNAWGSRQLIADASSPSGYRIEESLNEQDLANLNASRGLQGQLLGLAPNMIQTLSKTLNSGMDVGNLPAMVSGVDTRGLERLNLNIPQGQYGFQRGKVQGDLDFSGLNPLESGNAVRDRVEKAMFDKFMGRAQPQFDRQTDALNTRIANMGGNTSSVAARRMREELSQNQNDAMTNAQYDAQLRAGEEAQRQFGMGLQGRQQGVSEIGQQGQFRNAAQQQDFSQLGQLADLWNSTRGQDAQLQQGQAQFNNQTTQQNIQNLFQNASLQNAARAAGLNEMTALRQMPLNEIMAVLGGTQVGQPNFQGAAATGGWNPADMYGAAKDTYNAQVGANNARNAQRGGAWGALGSIAGSFFGPIGTAIGGQIGQSISDRRLKSNIVRVGETPGGIPVYEYDLFGARTRGVMADEVPENARTMGADGYWRVDYSKVT